MKTLWYDKEAKIWNEALPLGNGRIGAMVFGGPFSDRIALNEDTLWSGCPASEEPMHSMEEIRKIRMLIAEKKYGEAEKKTSDHLFDFGTQVYMPYGNLYIDVDMWEVQTAQVMDYRRQLDLECGVCTTTYKLGDINVTKTFFVSLEDNVMVVNIKSDKPLIWKFYESVALENAVFTRSGVLTVEGRCPTHASWPGTIEYDEEKESIHFCSMLKVISDQEVFGGGNALGVFNATDTTVLFSIQTSFNGYNKMPVSDGRDYKMACEDKLLQAEALGYEQLLKRHISAYKRYFERMSIKLGGVDYSSEPTDVRIQKAAGGRVDNQLVTLLFDFGRYLSIASSQPGTQPANLQGIWNDTIMPPWRSNYTMNINLEMNYWHVEACDLPECHMPLLKLIRELRERGNTYGLRGWSAWHNTDIWRFHHDVTKQPLWGYELRRAQRSGRGRCESFVRAEKACQKPEAYKSRIYLLCPCRCVCRYFCLKPQSVFHNRSSSSLHSCRAAVFRLLQSQAQPKPCS